MRVRVWVRMRVSVRVRVMVRVRVKVRVRIRVSSQPGHLGAQLDVLLVEHHHQRWPTAAAESAWSRLGPR